MRRFIALAFVVGYAVLLRAQAPAPGAAQTPAAPALSPADAVRTETAPVYLDPRLARPPQPLHDATRGETPAYIPILRRLLEQGTLAEETPWETRAAPAPAPPSAETAVETSPVPVPAPVPPKEEPSVLEKFFGAEEEPGLAVKRDLRQFGYDIFTQPAASFVSLDNVPVGPDYVLGPGDSLVVHVWGNVEQTFGVTVDRDGKIVLPEVGALTVWGVRFSRAEALIKAALGRKFANFQADVSMGKLRTIQVFVLGDAKKPGAYTLSSLATLFEAVHLAGGPTKSGSMRRIRLIRANRTVETVDLYRYLLKGDKGQDHRLASGDTIFIPPIGPVAAVAGNVKRPAIFELAERATVADLFEMGGGATPSAYLNRLQLERIKAHEKRVVADLEFAKPSEIAGKAGAVVLEDGDLVLVHPIVPQRRNFVTAEGNFRRPGDYEFKDGMRVSDLIARADGVLPECALERGEIFRYKSDRTREVVRFNVGRVLADDPKENILLHEWDIVKVYAVYDVYPEPMVRVEGSVNRPGVFRYVEGMKAGDLLFRGGNPSRDAYLDRADLFRLRTDRQRPSLAINLRDVMAGKPGADVALEPWDRLVVYAVPEILPVGSVAVEGTVNSPGSYELTASMRVSDLVFRARGLKSDAYLHRAEIYRFRTDLTAEMIAVDLAKAVAKNPADDILLRDRDLLKVYSMSEVLPTVFVEIGGAVYKPGSYELTSNMRVSDLVFRGGGLKRTAAPTAELYRQVPGSPPEVVPVDLARTGNDSGNLVLNEGDHLFVRYETEWVEKNIIALSGEVRYPGEYVVRKGETLLDILRRAGGFTEKAYLPGAVFIRQTVKAMQEKTVKRFLDEEQRKLYEEEARLGGVAVSDTERQEKMRYLEYKRKLLEALAEVDVPGRVVLNLAKVMDRDEGRKHDILIEDGDSLHVPQVPSSIQVIGAVYNPGSILFESGRDISFYLDKVGGPTEHANRRGVYMLRASGEIVSDARKFRDNVQRGDTIIVPEEFRYRTPIGATIKDISQVLYHISIAVAAIGSL